MFINETMLKEIAEGFYTTYLCEISALHQNFYLTTSDLDIQFNDNLYKGGYTLQNININNIDGKNELSLIIPNFDGTTFDVEEFLQSSVKIRLATVKDKQISNSIIIFNGYVYEISNNNNSIELLLLSKMSKLDTSVCSLFSPLCRECLGNSKCCVNLENYKSHGIITEMVSQDCFIGNHQENKKTPIGYYQYGIIKILTGKLRGLSLQLKDENEGKIYLLKNTKLLSVGDGYEIFAGCDKTLQTCKEKFNNIINFRGEPFINNT